jgi:hypothetical protein
LQLGRFDSIAVVGPIVFIITIDTKCIDRAICTIAATVKVGVSPQLIHL